MRKLMVAALLFTLTVMPVAMPAQAATATAREFFRAHTRQDWGVMAAMLDTSALRLAREAADELVSEIEDRSSQMTGGDAARLGPLQGMMERLMTGMIGATFAGTKSVDELKQLSEKDLLTRWLQAKSARHQAGAMGDLFGGLVAGAGDLAGASGMRMDSLNAMASGAPVEWQVIGEVAEGNAVTHVLYRAAGMNPPATTGVLTFAQRAGKWYVRVNSLDDEDQLGTIASLEMMALAARMR